MKRTRLNASANKDPGYYEVIKKLQAMEEFIKNVREDFKEDWEDNPIEACNYVIQDLQPGGGLRRIMTKTIDAVHDALDEQDKLY